MPTSASKLSPRAVSGPHMRGQRSVLMSAQADLAALRAAVVAITAKLDADAGVTDTNYAATCNPAALSTTT